jgi:hypothetical protein
VVRLQQKHVVGKFQQRLQVASRKEELKYRREILNGVLSSKDLISANYQ